MIDVALVTGGGSGLGRAACQALAANGMTVAVADLDRSAALATVQALPRPDSHRALTADVGDEAGIAGLFDSVERDLGPVRVLATFAGVLIAPEGRKCSIAESTVDDWNRTFEVNALGTFLCLREMLRRRRRAPVADGRIITVSSIAGQNGGVRGSAPYAASKGAILTLTRSAAAEAGPLGMTVNCIAPGMIDTPMLRQVLPEEAEATATAGFPLGRIGRPEEIGAVVGFLATPASGFMTGATIDVNGGQLAR